MEQLDGNLAAFSEPETGSSIRMRVGVPREGEIEIRDGRSHGKCGSGTPAKDDLFSAVTGEVCLSAKSLHRSDNAEMVNKARTRLG
jgi:hypothetical protein